MDTKYDDMTDEFGIPVQNFVDTAASLGKAMKARIRKRTTTATTNYLYLAGIPSTPAEVLSFAEFISASAVTSSITDGHSVLNEEYRTTDEEQAEADAAKQQASGLAGLLDQGVVKVPAGSTGYGAYL